MIKYFWESYLLTIIGLIAAYFWGEHIFAGEGLTAVFLALTLGVLEVSLSFDNAVVNALRLEKMSKKWQHRFLTIGILIAVFGMRFLFPLLIVACVAKLNIIKVLNLAMTNVEVYSNYLAQTHSSIVTFGGAFLMMIALNFFINKDKEVHWLKFIEEPLKKVGNYKDIATLITLIALFTVQAYILPTIMKIHIILAGLLGIATYYAIEGVSSWLEKKNEKRCGIDGKAVACTGLAGFIYLELIDASFSFDGVLGAFAISTDIIIIMIGLSIGAIFVRSLTILLVEKKTLKKFAYIAHGAHWAVLGLALTMFASVLVWMPEYVPATIGLVCIISSLIASIIENKQNNM